MYTEESRYSLRPRRESFRTTARDNVSVPSQNSRARSRNCSAGIPGGVLSKDGGGLSVAGVPADFRGVLADFSGTPVRDSNKS